MPAAERDPERLRDAIPAVAAGADDPERPSGVTPDAVAAGRDSSQRLRDATPHAVAADRDRRQSVRARVAPAERDRPARLLATAVRVMPAGRRDWGRAMQAELAAVEEPADRRSFAWGCVRAAAAEFHLLRGAVHLIVVLVTLATLLAWTGKLDFPPLQWILYAVVPILAGVCWEGRRAGMFGPTGDGTAAWLLRGAGYLLAATIVAVAVAHAHPATVEAVDDGTGILVLATVAASFVIGVVAVSARRSAATARVLTTGAGSGLAAAVTWLVLVFAAPPIPASLGWALTLTGAAASIAVLANTSRSSTTEGCLLAGLLATATTLALIFAGVVALAHWGPDAVIPDVTPAALPGHHITESRVEIVDPYVLALVLAAIAATALALTAVVTRRPAAR